MNFLTKFSVPLIAVCLLTGCGQAQSGETFPLTIRSGDKEHILQVEIAENDADRARGLMYREEMPLDHGMVFLFPTVQDVSFWMHDTYIPLDVIFIRTGGKISHIYRNAQPTDETPIPSNGPVKAVLEINGGQADKLGLKTGDTIHLEGKL